MQKKTMDKKIERFSFWISFLVIFYLTLLSLILIFEIVGSFEISFIESFTVIVISSFLLTMIFTILIKWLKEYKTKEKLVMDSKIEWWYFLFVILLFIFSTFNILNIFYPFEIKTNNPPIEIEDWNPYGYYG